jgi:1-acyl-sn-glycerol-3-phosphate acyltransferase
MTTRALRAFDVFFTPWRRRRLAGIHIAGLPRSLPAGQPLVLAANHTSWWDGFLLREVHRALRPTAHFTTVMLESELRRFPFFRRLGVEPVQPGSRASLRTLTRRLEALRSDDPDFVLAFFPQGRIWPVDRRPLGFQRGIDRLAAHIAPATLLPIALRIEALNRSTPTAFISVGAPLPVAAGVRTDVHAVEGAVTAQLEALRDFLCSAGERAPAWWPADPFLPLGELSEVAP